VEFYASTDSAQSPHPLAQLQQAGLLPGYPATSYACASLATSVQPLQWL